MNPHTWSSRLIDTRMKLTIIRVDKIFEVRVLCNVFDILHIDDTHRALGGPLDTNEIPIT